MRSLPAGRSSWQTGSGLFDDYGINQREPWNCFDLFTLFKNLCLIMQVMFEYILVIKNSNGANQVNVPLIEFTLSHVPPYRSQCSLFGAHPSSHTHNPLEEYQAAPNSHCLYRDRLSLTWGSLYWFYSAPFLSRANGKTQILPVPFCCHIPTWVPLLRKQAQILGCL